MSSTRGHPLASFGKWPILPAPLPRRCAREILRSEQQRMRVVAIDPGRSCCCLTTMRPAACCRSCVERLFPDGIAWWMPLAAHRPVRPVRNGGLRASSAGASRAARISRSRRASLNALVETSLPGVIIYALAQHMEPQLVFGFWPPMLYFVFIVLSTLRLDFWLSLWTGVVAAVQQFALALWLLPLDTDRRAAGGGADLPSEPQHHADDWPASPRRSSPGRCASSSRTRSRPPWRATG